LCDIIINVEKKIIIKVCGWAPVICERTIKSACECVCVFEHKLSFQVFQECTGMIILCAFGGIKKFDERVYSDNEFSDDRSTVMFIDYDCPNETAFRVGSTFSK